MGVALYFVERATALANSVIGSSASQEESGAVEILIPAPNGTLEISAFGATATIAHQGLLLEDRPLETEADADLLLAICDAVLAGEIRREGSATTAPLHTRGYLTVWKSA